MAQLTINASNVVGEEVEDRIINMLRPEFNYICSNSVRACILHLLMKAVDLNHTLRVEEIVHKLGKRHSVIVYHLEQLSEWKLVEVIKNSRYGNKQRRSIWGLNLKLPNLVRTVYTHVLKFFYTQNELEKMCSVNKNIRNNN